MSSDLSDVFLIAGLGILIVVIAAAYAWWRRGR